MTQPSQHEELPDGWSAVPADTWVQPTDPHAQPATAHPPEPYPPGPYPAGPYPAEPYPPDVYPPDVYPPGTWPPLKPVHHRPGGIPLRALSILDIVVASVRVIARNLRTTLALNAVVCAVTGTFAIAAIIVIYLTCPPDPQGYTDTREFFTTLVLLATVAIIASALVSILAHPVNQDALGRRAGVGESLRAFTPAIGRLACALLLLGAIEMLLCVPATFGLLLTLDQGIGEKHDSALKLGGICVLALLTFAVTWFPVRTVATLPSVATEGLGPLTGLHRSFTLTSWSFWRYFVALTLLTVIAAVPSYIAISLPLSSVAAPDSQLAGDLLLVLGIVVTALISQPVLAVGANVIHLDARMRYERYDLTLIQVSQTPHH
ncbi:MAG: hypothetical protein QM673_08350 [Gordonia sp. (in: high G+C Gram-positive bacteria)]